MDVAGATGDPEKISEQIMIERLLDAVSPELRAWLKERKPVNAEELGNMANLHVQSRKGPLVDGRYAPFGSQGFKQKRSSVVPVQKETQRSFTQSKIHPSPSSRSAKPKPEITCFKCGQLGHMSFNCSRGRNKPPQGSLLCMTPLEPKRPQFPPCNVRGKISGIPAEMVVDSGCTRTLVHERFMVDKDPFTGDEITVLTASGERLIVPLAWVQFESDQGEHLELVGVLSKLPVDCLLGRSSFGQTLSRDDVLRQWEKIVSVDGSKGVEAFVLTRRQKALEEAQQRADSLVDRENALALKNLSKRESKKNGLNEGDLRILFGDKDVGEEACENSVELSDSDSDGDTRADHLPLNILDRNKEQLIKDQNSDVTLLKARNGATYKEPMETDGFFLKGGLLMHHRFNKSVHNGVRFVDRIVIPEFYRNEILRIGHTIPLSGHMGTSKTLSRIGTHFYWPGLAFDIRKYRATCPQCQLVARKLKSNRAPLSPVAFVTEPFRKIAIDIVGELPRSSTGYKYILTIVDYATRYPEAIPLRSVSSKTVADALVQYFCRIGIPQELVSDQGCNFVGQLMTQLYEQLGITKIKTSVYHPEGNGLVERFNGTLKAMLKKFAQERVQSWDKFLPYLLFAYREVPCESTGYSPFELLFGRTVRGPLSVIKESWLGKEIKSERNLVSHVLEIRRRLAMMQRLVQDRMKRVQGTQKRLHDVHSSTRSLKVGDKALVLLPTPGSKLEVHWQGPFKVTKVFNGGLHYEIDTGKSHKQHRVYHINLLSKWQSRDETASYIMSESFETSLPHEKCISPFCKNETWEDVIISDALTKDQKDQVKDLLRKYADVFSGNPSVTSVATHRIDTGDSAPIRCSPYKVPQKLEEVVNNEIENMLKMGIIRPSACPWAFPVVVVPKPDGTIRLCVDYRKLNSITKMDAYPVPSTDRMIEKIALATYITTLDLTKGYWQIPLDKSTIEKSAFITTKGLYEFLVMPFGMKTAGATFQRMMSDVVLKGFNFAGAYIDDLEVDTQFLFTTSSGTWPGSATIAGVQPMRAPF